MPPALRGPSSLNSQLDPGFGVGISVQALLRIVPSAQTVNVSEGPYPWGWHFELRPFLAYVDALKSWRVWVEEGNKLVPGTRDISGAASGGAW
jgi:hypothetical protein